MGPPGWREPSSLLPLRFGTYRGRYVSALVLILVGGVSIQFASVYTLGLLIGGLVATVAGWVVMPSVGWRRSVAALLGVVGSVALLNGAQSSALATSALVAWLLVRMRPSISWTTLGIPLVTAFILAPLFPQYGWGVLVACVVGAALVGSAWLARSLAASRRAPVSSGRGASAP